ncbi:phosphoethanolamine transferase [Polaromonas sp. UC242_47]|uniref:phosphoethanolamine transferase n=1 Tax=Polaromonas sp. UC242_47 TaxID=3374626 RepID=UPI0037A1AD48
MNSSSAATLKPLGAPSSRRWPQRPTLQLETLVLLCVCFFLLAGNGPFWRAAMVGRSWEDASTWGFAAAMFCAFAAFYFAFVALLSTRLTVKPLLTVLVLCTAFASWYMDRYAIYMDRAMLRNVLATNVQEARELLVWGMVPHVLLLGVLPVALLWWPRLKPRSLRRAFALRLAWVAAALVVGVLSLLLVFADFASLMRNHREVRHLLTPGNVVASLIANTWGSVQRPNQARLPVGADAKMGAAWSGRSRPLLFVLVVGETARAQNFSLNGYARPTNPQLAQRDVINYPHATACGTSTEVSLPCMFSPFGRANYDEDKIRSHESLLHVLARAGFKVLWRDNQSGCKGVCDGLPTEQMDHASVPALCAEGQCLDEVLLHGMEGIARDAASNLVVVMHQLGSHGPAYYKRYPAVFKRFTPACENEDLRGCSAAEIVNAYDNSLLYTDFFLSRVIDFLDRSQKNYDTAMLYVSDHGESLGDNGLYLHGMPYPIAPDVQKRVPLVMWLSSAFRDSFKVNQDCMRSHAGAEVSHDNLFHSLLGVLDVETQAYNPKLDLFAPCRPAPALALKGPGNAP